MSKFRCDYWIPSTGFLPELGMEIVGREYRNGILFFRIKAVWQYQ